ncbi:MAG TPA: tRNA glutamyl-Q(34) synthetase GluQRS [Sandaracinaceae bacterium LLY-WYZ-13_1]|nr:tRNA glutamyl-Q(34) synthetase GluQRS [Sandaracinaceae bacterium LLY-WYZ-13_1]
MPAPSYRGRFAPSPTGRLHLGTARSALIGWLRARRQGGAFVLRMEDLDGPRVVEGAAEAILEDLRWLGLDWDEGPDVGGRFGPYTQSERFDRYREVLEALASADATYPCTCSRKEIAAIASAPHGDEGPIYPGLCRDGPLRPERDAAIRFRMPDPPPAFTDVFAGPQAGIGRGDFVIFRKDGVFAYQLACVVDDHDEGITEVLRGDDLLSSTPRQIALYRALGWTVPAFCHVPLVLGPDGQRLAKRHGSISLDELRAAGWTPARVVGHLAHGAGLLDEERPITPSELVGGFELSRLGHEPTVEHVDEAPAER